MLPLHCISCHSDNQGTLLTKLELMQLLQQLELENKAIFKTHGQQLGRLKVVRDLLESSLLRLDDTSALFNDF